MEFSLDIVIYLLGLASMWGSMVSRIKTLEKKMDKHNCIVERLAAAEANIRDMDKEYCGKFKAVHHRIDEVKK